ncbi:MAG: A/G-specific adenine glycosylase [Candidatus Saccharibacteria bacterium]
MPTEIVVFRDKVWDFYREYGRDLAWRHDPTPYQVVVSELMLQQTQVARVSERYPRWMKRFPSFEVLANATVAEVLEEWQGMGYNRRALFLHRIAQAVVTDYGGILPADPTELVKLPGIGANTAGSVAAFVYDAPVVFIETNIRRVFIHEFFQDSDEVHDKELMPLIEQALDTEHPREWYYALMDYGSHLAKTVVNPNRRSKHHTVQSKFEGSKRQIRGEVLRQLLTGAKREFEIEDERLDEVLKALESEGFITVNDQLYSLVK